MGKVEPAASGRDSSNDLDALAQIVLGEPPTMNRLDVASMTGQTSESVAAQWRALGYPDVEEDAVAFTTADVQLLEHAQELLAMSSIDPASEELFLRTIGRTFSRLAEWQVRIMLQSTFAPGNDESESPDLSRLSDMLSIGADVQEVLWRRHLFGAAARLATNRAPANDSEPGCAGFVDIVGFTSRSRSMTSSELATMIDRFETVVSDLVAEHAGRVVKTIGDEILFVVDDPTEAAWLGVELASQHRLDPTFPNVRVGMAYGDMLNRLGDVLGPVVNLASRLTSAAPAGRVLIDPAMASHVQETAGLRARKLRRIAVKGFAPIEPFSLRFERDHGRTGLRGALEGILEDATDDLAMRVPQRPE